MIILPEGPPPPPYDLITRRPALGDKRDHAQQFVHYRLYTSRGALRSKTASVVGPHNALEQVDPFLGRIPAHSIPPPHNVGSLKRSIGSKERFTVASTRDWTVYANSEQTNMLEDSEKIAILGPGGVDGGTPETAFVVVMRMPLELLRQQHESDANNFDVPPYLYYRLFTTADQEASKTAFKPMSEPSFGRIAIVRIPPPQDVSAIKQCIARVEGQPKYASAQLFQSMAAELPMEDGSTVSLGQDGIGSSEYDPVVLVRPEGNVRLGFGRTLSRTYRIRYGRNTANRAYA